MKVLIADDDHASRSLLEALLAKWGYDVASFADGLSAWEVIQGQDPPRLAILDWRMPGMSGPEICRKLRRQGREEHVYIMLLTARDTMEDIVAGLEAGADDYLAKPFDPHELRARLRAGRRMMELQADLIAARQALQHQADHDPLTGLWNRAAIFGIATREIARATRDGAPLAVAMADIDHFKRVNDTLGHLAGDAALRETARRLASSVRPYDSVARYGGEEFLCILPQCDGHNAVGVAERIRQAVQAEPVALPEGSITLTASLGVAAGCEITRPEALIGAADAALYRAKRAGRNRVEQALEADLARALH